MSNLFGEAPLLMMMMINLITFSLLPFASPVKNSWVVALNHTGFLQERNNKPHQESPTPYIFNLYHRDMFERSKFTDNESLLEARIARDISRSKYLASLFGSYKNISELDEEQPTGLVFYTGEYVVSFYIGSEDEKQLLLLDLGSPMVWWQCLPCQPSGCYYQDSNPIFNSSASTTFNEVVCEPGASFYCNPSTTITTCSPVSNRCAYRIRYGSGQWSKGHLAYEWIGFSQSHSRRRIAFGCGKDQTSGSKFNGHFAGIAGLGGGLDPDMWGRLSLPVQLHYTLFSFCLPSPSSGVSSLLYFGPSSGISPDFRRFETPILKDDKLTYFYFVQLVGIRVGRELVFEAPDPVWNGRIFVDSGSEFTRIPRGAYLRVHNRIWKLFAEKQILPYDDPRDPFELCYDIDKVSLSDFPSVELIFNSTVDDYPSVLRLRKQQVAVESAGSYCLAIVAAEFQEPAHFGHTQLYTTTLTFDLSAMILSFKQNTCS